MKLVKDRRILDLVSRLGLEKRGWVIADDWEADLCAIGIARTVTRQSVFRSTLHADSPANPPPMTTMCGVDMCHY